MSSKNKYQKFNIINMKRDWSNITLKDFYEIQDIIAIQDDYTLYNLIDYLYGVDSINLPISEVRKYSLSFLHDNMDDIKIDIFHDEKYDFDLNLTNISVAQFVDYQNYIKETPIRYEKILSCFVIPKGHEYNDGYSLKEVQEDILNWQFAIVKKMGFFFSKQLQLFVTIFLSYLKEETKGTEKEKEIITLLDKTNSLLSELYRTS